MKTNRYIITASDEVCTRLRIALANHPLVISIFENSGFWYTNGETGPEWFTVTIEALCSNKEKIENLVQETLKKIGEGTYNYYWS